MTSTNATPLVRVGVLGCGFFGRSLAEAMSRQPSATVVAVADTSQAAASQAAEAVGALATTTDRILTEHDLDAVLVATPNMLHPEHVIACCEAGLDVFVEKPMALNAQACMLMLDAASRADVTLVVGHIMRTMPAVRRLKGMLDRQELGEIRRASGSLVRWMNQAAGPTDWWKHDASRSGGDILHEIHILDLLCWLLDPDEVIGLGTSNDALLAMHARDALISFELCSTSRFPRWGIQIDGTLGSAELDLRTATLTLATDDGTTSHGVFDDPAADQSLLESAGRKSAHNVAGSTAALWMQKAIDDEMAEVCRIFAGATESPLLDRPDQAVAIATSALGSG